MVKVTLDIPEELLGDIYVAVGAALRRGYEDEHEAARDPSPKAVPESDTEPVAGADGTGA